jgi:uncharacterized protein (TIGR02145 family)
MNMKKHCHIIIVLVCAILLSGKTENLFSQDILLDFAGTGASTTVTSVKVENLTQGTFVTINGGDILHLMNVITGIESGNIAINNRITFTPNPMKDYSRMLFDLPLSGETFIALFDISGKEIATLKQALTKGQNAFIIRGVTEGAYLIRINSGKFSITGKLICLGSEGGNPEITFESLSASVGEKQPDLINSKGSQVPMQYNNGDVLKFTSLSGNSSTVVTDIPTSSKTITFNFVPCFDKDANIYSVVQIDTQVWMAENLKTTKFNDGTGIPKVTDAAAWTALRYAPAYCWPMNDSTNYNRYGALYDWWSVSNGSLCPTGWHVPSDNEFLAMENYLISHGYNYDNSTSGNYIGIACASPTSVPDQGGMRELWYPSSTPGDIGSESYSYKRNISGFSAFAVAFRVGDGSFGVFGNVASWWTSTSVDMGRSRYHSMNYNNNSLAQAGATYNWVGFSVRCVKD